MIQVDAGTSDPSSVHAHGNGSRPQLAASTPARAPGGLADRYAGLLHGGVVLLAVVVVAIPAIALGAESRVFTLQLGLALLLAFLPGWIYVQFARSKGRGLYDEYVLNLFRLRIDEPANLPAPPQHTSYYERWHREHSKLPTDTKDNLYRSKFESLYGRGAVSTFDLIYDRLRIRDGTETLGPVLLATLVLGIGWVLVLQPFPSAGLEFVTEGVQRPALLFSALQAGFFGAYVFILQDLTRRFFRDDLRTGAYLAAAARVVVVALLVSVVHLAWPPPAAANGWHQESVLAFLIGFFPQAGLQVLHAVLAKPLALVVPSVRTRHPLSRLDGLTIWYEARLAEEGVDDMQNLVSANLVDLLLRSRAPVARLVDWLDQAALHVHLPDARGAEGMWGRKGSSPADELRRLGIRSATDLERAWERAADRDRLARAVGTALGVPAGDARVAVESLLAALHGENNLFHVREFKRRDWLEKQSRSRSSVAGLNAPAGQTP